MIIVDYKKEALPQTLLLLTNFCFNHHVVRQIKIEYWNHNINTIVRCHNYFYNTGHPSQYSKAEDLAMYLTVSFSGKGRIWSSKNLVIKNQNYKEMISWCD